MARDKGWRQDRINQALTNRPQAELEYKQWKNSKSGKAQAGQHNSVYERLHKEAEESK